LPKGSAPACEAAATNMPRPVRFPAGMLSHDLDKCAVGGEAPGSCSTPGTAEAIGAAVAAAVDAVDLLTAKRVADYGQRE